MRQIFHLPALLGDYKHLLREWQPEHVIHTSWHHLLLLWPYLDQTRDWYWVHEVLPNLPHYSTVFRRMGSKLAGFIPVSHAVAESLRSLGIADQQIHVIHNGIGDLPPVSTARRSESTDVRFGIIGQVAPWKGHHDLLEAFAKMSPANPGCTLHIYGSGIPSYESQLKSQAARLNVSERIGWHGFLEDRASIYAELDVCVVPVPLGANEALPTVAIEAGLCGLPVVGSRRGGLPEIVKHGISGTLVECGDIEALTAALHDLAGSPEKRTAFGQSALEITKAEFCRSQFVAAFERLLGSPTPRPLSPP